MTENRPKARAPRPPILIAFDLSSVVMKVSRVMKVSSAAKKVNFK